MSTPLLSLQLLLVAALLSGCATRDYVVRPLDPQAAATQWQQRRLDDPRLLAWLAERRGAAPRPVAEWGLDELTLAALFHHPDLDIARAQLQAAQATQRVAAARPGPRLGLQADHHAQADGISPWTLGLSLEVPLDLGERRAARIERAAALGEVARLEIGASAWRVRSRLHARYVELLAAAARVELSRREATLRREITELLATRLRSGAAAAGEAAAARLQQQRAEAAVAAETAALVTARAGLAAAVGVPAAALPELPLPVTALDAGRELPAAEVQQAAVLNRLDLRAGLSRYAAAEAKLRLEIARQSPEIALAPGVAYDQGDRVWSLGASLLLALFDRNAGPIAEAEAQREVEAQRFLALQAQVLGEQAAALATLHAAAGERAALAAAASVAMRQAEAAARRVAAGNDDRLDLARRRLEALGAEGAALNARVAQRRALAALEDSVQRPLAGALTELSAPGENRP